MEEMSMEDFMMSGMGSKKSKKSVKSRPKKVKPTKEEEEPGWESTQSHKLGLADIQAKDPDFYKFLIEQEPDLLNFEMSSDESEPGEEDYHEPPDKLEIASDDSDYDSDEEIKPKKGKKKKVEVLDEEKQTQPSGKMIAMKMVKEWHVTLVKNPSFDVVREIIEAFRAAVAKSGADIESHVYLVPDSTIFNAIIRLCFTELLTALRRLFDIDEVHKKASDLRRKAKWLKYKPDLKLYLSDVILLLGEVQESELVCSVVKQIHELLPFYYGFPKLTKAALKALVRVWSRKDETCRVAALIAIVKIVQKCDEFFTIGIKALYLAYVNNSKVVSQETWPSLNFMQRSFAEVVSLNAKITYEYSFVYIRQMAIHLRNAMTAKRKDVVGVVYNGQYMMCVYLWCRTLSLMNSNPLLNQLIHPLTQIVFACARLVPSSKYLPLRFHCVRALLYLMENDTMYTPVMSLVTEVLTDQLPFLNRKRTTHSVKPYMLDCMFKVSKGQLVENGYPDAVMETAVELMLRCTYSHVNSIGFPELIAAPRERVRLFGKDCKIGNYCRKVKSLFDKFNEHAKYIEDRRRTHLINLANLVTVARFEKLLKKDEAESPLGKYYKSWKAIHEQELLKKIYRKDQIVDIDVRKVPRQDQRERMKRQEEKKRMGVSKSFEQIMQQDDQQEDAPDRFDPNKILKGRMNHALKFDFSDDEIEDEQNEQNNSDSDDQPETKRRKTREVNKKKAADKLELMRENGEEDKVVEMDSTMFD